MTDTTDVAPDPTVYAGNGEDWPPPFTVQVTVPDRMGVTITYRFTPGGEFEVERMTGDVRALVATQLRYLADLMSKEA